MGLFSFLKGHEPPASKRAAAVDPVQAARARARRRLIGAAVLLGVGVIGFPLLFETSPRPIPVDLPIDIPRKEGAPSLPLPPPRVASAAATTPRVSSGVITERRAEPRREAPQAASQAKPDVARTPSSPASGATAKPAAPSVDDGDRARALLEGKAAESKSTEVASTQGKPSATKAEQTPANSAKPAASATTANGKPDALVGRFVVQVAAYSEASAARDMRQRVEKLGLKSYTQPIEIDGVKRIRVRVGPFPARDDAEKAAATLKEAGLPAAVLAL